MLRLFVFSLTRAASIVPTIMSSCPESPISKIPGRYPELQDRSSAQSAGKECKILSNNDPLVKQYPRIEETRAGFNVVVVLTTRGGNGTLYSIGRAACWATTVAKEVVRSIFFTNRKWIVTSTCWSPLNDISGVYTNCISLNFFTGWLAATTWSSCGASAGPFRTTVRSKMNNHPTISGFGLGTISRVTNNGWLNSWTMRLAMVCAAESSELLMRFISTFNRVCY